MKMKYLIALVLSFTLCGCRNIKKEVVQSVSPTTFVSPYAEYTGEYKSVTTKYVEVQLPSKAEVYSESFDGIVYHICARGDNLLYELMLLPFEVASNEAYGYLKPATQDVFGSFPTLKQFTEGTINGVYATLKDDDKPLMYGESFCFNKDGFTFYLLSYGATSNYYSTFEVVKRIKPLSEPLNDLDKKAIANGMKEKFVEACVDFINESIQRDQIIHNDFTCSQVDVDLDSISIKCILTGDYSQLYPGQKSILRRILTGARCIKPYNRDFELLGYNFMIGFYKPSGEKLDLSD